MILQIERSWGKHPGWFDELEPHQQERLLGEWLAENTADPQKPAGPPVAKPPTPRVVRPPR